MCEIGDSGVIESESTLGNTTNSSVWTFIHPFHQKYNDLTAIICSQTCKSYTFGQISEASLRWARELTTHVTHPESPPTVAILCPNNIEYPILALGAFAAGCPLCPMRHDFQPEILLSMMRRIRVKILVTDFSLVEKFRKAIQGLGEVQVYVKGSQGRHLLPDLGRNCSVKSFDGVVFSNSPLLDVEIAKKVEPESVAMIPFSSGTTGVPKAILTNHKAVVAFAETLRQRCFHAMKEPDDSFQGTLVGNLPQAHTYGLILYFLALPSFGYKVIDLSSTDLDDFTSVVQRFQPQIVTLRPYQLEALSMRNDIKEKLGSIETVINVGAPPNPRNFEKFRDFMKKNLNFMDHYGSTEVGLIAITHYWHSRLEMKGNLAPSCKAKFVDVNTGRPITKPHQRGELYVKTAEMMLGYLDNPEATKEAFDEENWYKTGDLGLFDEDKCIRVFERFKDLITVKGIKVYPSSIEEVVMKHPKVVDTGVVGVPDLITGEELTRAFVVTKSTVGQQEIIDFVKENASPEKWISGGVVFLDNIPRNHMGKILRKFLREMSWTGKTSF